MTTEKQIFDNPTGWVRDHIKTYVESGGQKGHRWRGLPTLLLTTRGRKTGQLCRTALIYGQDGDRYLIVASNGGATTHPLWYLNLIANSEVAVQVGADKFVAHARTATAPEKPALWQIMSQIFPQYNSYEVKAAKAGREIPVIILEPVKQIEGVTDDSRI